MNDEDDTPFAEVIGDPISQSKSPVIHGFWLKRLGIEARYGARRVSQAELTYYLEQRKADPLWLGCNVTMPLKQAIIPQLDRVEDKAKAIGAVNTVYRSASGDLTGTNTDVDGFLEPLADKLASTHLFRMARIIGTGGAARAVVCALVEHGFTLVLIGRNVGKARALLDELAAEGEHYTPPLVHFAKPTDFAFDDREGCLDLIINASSLGMRGQPELELDFSHAPPGSLFYDIVTDPVETTLLKTAREKGFDTIGGIGMLIGQAAAAFEIFFGQAPPREFDPQLREMLRK